MCSRLKTKGTHDENTRRHCSLFHGLWRRRSAFAQSPETQGVTDKEVFIGQMGPFAGPAYLYGKISMNGAEAVFDQVNETGGIAGRRLVLVREDDGCKAEGAIGAVKKLAYETKVFAIMGGACSNSTLAARPEIEKAGIPFIVNSASADSITDPPVPKIFRYNQPVLSRAVHRSILLSPKAPRKLLSRKCETRGAWLAISRC